MEDLIKREDAIEVVAKSKLMTAGAMLDCKRRMERLPTAESNADQRAQRVGSVDTISRQAAIDAIDRIFDRCEEIEAHLPEGDPDRTGYKMYPDYMTVWEYLHQVPYAEPKTGRCETCKRNADNGGFYDDGRTRCPIQEHYVLLKDGYCHLYEPRMRGEEE